MPLKKTHIHVKRFSPPFLSDQTAALRGPPRAPAACDAHHELRELPAAGLAVGPGQPGVGAQPLGRGRLGLLTLDVTVERHSREHRGRVVLFVNRFLLSVKKKTCQQCLRTLWLCRCAPTAALHASGASTDLRDSVGVRRSLPLYLPFQHVCTAL